MKAMTEKQFAARVERLCELYGWRHYHTYNSRRSVSGFPDYVLVRGARLMFRELKTDTGRVTAEQQAWLDELRAAGADADVWRPADLERGRIVTELRR